MHERLSDLPGRAEAREVLEDELSNAKAAERRYKRVADFSLEPSKRKEAKRKEKAWKDKGLWLRTLADPALEFFGAAEESHPEEFRAILEDLRASGVDVRIYPRVEGGPEFIAYGVSATPGMAGNLKATEGMSYSAWLHEYTHFKDDQGAGFPGHAAILSDLGRYAEMERHAYQEEVDLASEAGYDDLADTLRAMQAESVARARRGDIFGNDG